MRRCLIHYYIYVCITALTLTACNGDNSVMMPDSIGNAYDVTLVTKDKRLCNVALDILDTVMPAMTQYERLFTILTFNSISGATRYRRTLVMVRLTGDKTHIRYEHNAYASPQLLVFIESPSAEQLKTDCHKAKAAITKLIDGFETATAVQRARKSPNRMAQQEIRRLFNARIDVPNEMASAKRGKDFLWFSDNGTKTMRNICVYATPGTDCSANRLVDLRDSVMARNIPGERQGMFMTTEHRAGLRHQRRGPFTVIHGLWAMKDDAMGGPFVSLSLPDTTRRRTITAEAFLYAPSVDKAQTMRQLEALLYTLRLE